MENPTVCIGIDVSKATLDICKLSSEGKQYYKIKNTPKAIAAFCAKLDASQTIVAMENTGRYNWNLYGVLADLPILVYVIHPLHLKQSMGMVRGKTDQLDCYRIARYIQRHYDELEPWKPESPSIKHLKLLLTERRQLLKHRSRVKAAQKDYKLIDTLGYLRLAKKRDKRRLKDIAKDLKEVEAEIRQVIKADSSLSELAELLQSIPGVGPVLCWNLLAKTKGFSILTDPRKLACFAGVAPFQHESGTSIRRRPRVSTMADKKLKTVLHMAAMRAVRVDPELMAYYEKKVDQGKNKMLVLNAVRNKLIHRVCAVVRRQSPFQISLPVS